MSQRFIALVMLITLSACNEDAPDRPSLIAQRVGKYVYVFDPRSVENVYGTDDGRNAVIRLGLRLPGLTQFHDLPHATGDDVIHISFLPDTGPPILGPDDYKKLFSSWSKPSHLVASKYGLNELLPTVPEGSRLLFPADGRRALIQCSKATTSFHGSCDYDSRFEDLRVNLHFSARCLPYWREIEKESTDLIKKSRGRLAPRRTVSARTDEKNFCIDAPHRGSIN